MKKLLIVLSMVLGISASAAAQSRTIGVRASLGGEVSYQHSLGESNFVEADLGFWGGAADLQGIYNFILASPSWSAGTWNVYAGPGVGAILGGGFQLGVTAQVGLEYFFDEIPLQLSLDVRPNVVSFGSGGTSVFTGFFPALGVRYSF